VGDGVGTAAVVVCGCGFGFGFGFGFGTVFLAGGLAAALWAFFGAVVRRATTAERSRIDAGSFAVTDVSAGAWPACREAARRAVFARAALGRAAVVACAVATAGDVARWSDAIFVTLAFGVPAAVRVFGFGAWTRGGAASMVVPSASATRTGRPPSAGPSSLLGRLTRTASAVATSAPASA
jgi:hypothetical protein